jgi:Uma2 family endonuclease
MQLLERTTDQSMIHADRTWEQFKLIQLGFEASPGVRLFYFNGTIEILMPGRLHELFKSLIGMLLEIFFVENGIEFEPTGSMTQEIEGEVSAQADESYCIGASKNPPDLAIEVVFTSGGSHNLKRYLALGVPEVWFWTDGLFTLHRLRGDPCGICEAARYEQIRRSEIPDLANLDLDLLTRCVLMGETSRLEAARTFCQGIQ